MFRNPRSVNSFKERALLDVLRLNVFVDVCGNTPISSLNYVWITCHIMLLFMKFEDQFREARHPQRQLRRQKRLALVVAAMAEEDDQALRLFAERFENLRLGALACIFWEDLREEESGVKPAGIDHEISTDQCSIM